MNENLKVSIITVCYNAEGSIENTIKSVLSQTYKNIEYIIVDGKSLDSTLKIINQYKESIDKIISEKDNGIFDAMNKGIKSSTGDILYFLNSDDKFFDNTIIHDVVQEFTADPGIGIVNGKVQFINIPPQYLSEVSNYTFEYKTKKHLLAWSNPQQCLFLRKWVFDKVGLFNTKYKIVADYHWFARCFDQGIKMKFMDRKFAFFNCQGTSYQKRYEILGEKIGFVYQNTPLIEFIYYLVFASFKKTKIVIQEIFVYKNFSFLNFLLHLIIISLKKLKSFPKNVFLKNNA